MMLYSGSDDMTVRIAGCIRFFGNRGTVPTFTQGFICTDEGPVVGLGTARCEEYLIGCCADKSRTLFSGIKNCPLRVSCELVDGRSIAILPF